MQPTSSSALDIPSSHIKTHHSTNQRQAVDSSQGQIDDKTTFKETLEKSTATQKELKSTEKKAQEKIEKNFSSKDNLKFSVINESSFFQSGNAFESLIAFEPLTIDQPMTAVGLNLNVLTDNGLSHTVNIIPESVSWLSDQNFGLDDFRLGGKVLTNQYVHDMTAVESGGFASPLSLPNDFRQKPQLISAGSSTIESSDALGAAQNLSVITGSVIHGSSATTNTSHVLNPQLQPLGQDNGALPYNMITHDPKIMAVQSTNNDSNQNAMLMHNKIGLQLNTLLNKSQVDGGVLEASLDSDLTVELSEPEIKNQVLNAVDRAEQRGAIVGSDKIIVSAHVKVGMPGWADQIAERTASLVSQNIKQAEIQLNPQDMGAINVKISVNQEQVAVTFTAQNAGVRDALDQGVQRLRETLEAEGMDLVQADVGGQSEQSDSSASDYSSERVSDLPEGEGELQNILVSKPSSGIDQFA